MKDVFLDTAPAITPVPLEYLDTVWPQVKGFVDRAVKTQDDTFTTTSVYEDIKRKFYMLWVVVSDEAITLAFTTRILEYPNRRALAIDWVGGTGAIEMMSIAQGTLQEYAKANNCKHLEGCGRRGWGRVLERHGWKPEYTAYRMELSDDR